MEYKINTLLPIQFEKAENPPYLNDSRYQAVNVYVAHEKENYNGSYFDLTILEEMGKYMAGVPIVGYITANNVNEKDFNGHEERLTIDKNGVTIEYLGRAYGCIISNDDVEIVDRLHEDGQLRKYLKVTGVLWKMFSDAIEIMDRDELKTHSMELQEDSIQGKFEKDGYFHFTQAKVRALCILGEGIQPAMSNSCIEKFSQDSVAEMLKEINDSIKEYNIKHQSSFEVDNKNSKEGGKEKLDEKLKLIDQYNLKVEDLEFSIEEISLEDLENKLKEFKVIENNESDTDNKEGGNEEKVGISFSATYRQKRGALENALDPVIIKDANGKLVSEIYYWVADFSDEYVFVERNYWDANGYECTKGRFTYSFNDTDVTVTITSEFEKMITDVWLTEAEYQELQQKREQSNSDYEKLKTDYTTLESEVNELRSFKQTIETEQRNEAEKELYSQFPQLEENEEFKKLKENASNFTLEQLEKEIAYIALKVDGKFSKKQEENTIIKVGVNFSKKDNKSDSCYGDLFDKYGKSKKDDE